MREAAAPRFLPEHACGPRQAWALWPDFCVFVFAAAALVHCARRGYGILFLFLAASPSGAEPACSFQRCSRSPIISVENADIRSNAYFATLPYWTATCFSTIESSCIFFYSLTMHPIRLFFQGFSILESGIRHCTKQKSRKGSCYFKR